LLSAETIPITASALVQTGVLFFVLEFNGNITSLGEVRNAEKTKPTNLEPGTEILLLIQHSKFEVCSLLYLLCWKRGGIFRQ